MDALTFETIAFVLMALSLPLISFGATAGTSAVWIAGLAVLAAGAAIPPLLRYAGPSRATA